MSRYDSLGDQMQAEAEDAEDAEAALQDAIEAEEESIRDYPGESPELLDSLSGYEKDKMQRLIRKLISQYRYQGEERAQGLQDVAQEILDICGRAIHEQAVINAAGSTRASRFEITTDDMEQSI